MNYEALRLAKLHREVVGLYYTPVGFDSVEKVNYHGEVESFTPCKFCVERAEHQHFVPSLQIFNDWIEKEEFRLLEQIRLVVVPVCPPCLEKLDKSVSTSLDDQHAYLDAVRTGKFYPFGAKN